MIGLLFSLQTVAAVFCKRFLVIDITEFWMEAKDTCK